VAIQEAYTELFILYLYSDSEGQRIPGQSELLLLLKPCVQCFQVSVCY